MKKIAYISAAFALIFSMACATNNENSDSQDEVMTEGTDEAMEEMNNEEENNEREISVQELPESVASAVRSSYEDYTISEVEEITAPDGVITYEIELKKDGEEMDVIYGADGRFMGIEEEDDDDNGDNGEMDDDEDEDKDE